MQPHLPWLSPSLRTGILFDLYFYHDRWREVGLSEVRQNLLPAQPSGLRGFTPVDGVAENMDKAPFTRQPETEDVYEQNLGWLQKIVDLCVSEGITPVVIFHPTYSQLPDEWHERMAQDITAMDGALFFDLSRSAEDIRLDPMTDYFDAGHLNEGGAEQCLGLAGDLYAGQYSFTGRMKKERKAVLSALFMRPAALIPQK